jgi:[glutamine synthetase] adenylyltransferase / [glutamine synthetase]-adenylyl-L-tyrosine phosphorylase
MDAELKDRVKILFPDLAEDICQQFIRVCSLSDYVRQSALQHSDIVGELIGSGDLLRQYENETLSVKVKQSLKQPIQVSEFDSKLRRIRRREMVRIIFRDFSRISDLVETTRDLSDLAESSIDTALNYHYQNNCSKLGVPTSHEGVAQKMCVLALGKLGAKELNLSSDIDLIFLYDKPGFAVSESGREISNQEFFLRTSRQLIASLDNRTEEGFVFRVDMRLRPYGESSALILHWAAMEKYFLEQGREWERYAFIKARAVGGDLELGSEFLSWLKPFVYRKHLDYGAIESLREMKRLIDRQVEIKEIKEDLKLGVGGIREIEFITQANQLIFGGRHAELQERSLLKSLETVGRLGYLPVESVELMADAYVFLRNSEHGIQGEADRQTQKLPESELSRSRLAEVMGYPDWQAYMDSLNHHREIVRDCFSTLMSANQTETEYLVEGDLIWNNVWGEPSSTQAIKLLGRTEFKEPERVSQLLSEISNKVAELQDIGQERINKLMPYLLKLIEAQRSPDTTLERLLPIVESILRRSTYLAYLLENADALKRMVDLCAMSPWVAMQLKEYPILLYELSGRQSDDVSFDKEVLVSQLDNMMKVLEDHDLEAQMDTLRQFKRAAVLRVAVFELLDLLPVMKASDALTIIAEIVLQRAYELAWNQLILKHGSPRGGDESEVARFAIVAYGKLGGIELAYGSDLDLVFLIDGDMRGNTDGEKVINNNVFFLRLAQRLIHIVTSMTRFGVLYEVDMRLRPSGNKGPMVSTMTAFERYQREEAWTWEHQALVRSRFVAGDEALGIRFTDLRRQLLSLKRDNDKLKGDVVEMREKMRESLSSKTSEEDLRGNHASALLSFDLKHDLGAIVDIEFMVQYAVLAGAHGYESLTRWTDKMRLLDELGEISLFSPEEVELLQRAYLAYRSVVHYQWLGGEMTSFSQLQEFRQAVVTLWHKHMDEK